MLYTIDDINRLREAAKHYKLNASARFWQYQTAELQKRCNGAGPARWSEDKRRALTSALRRYEAAFAIHDDDYTAPHLLTQAEADKRLKANMIKIWRRDFGVWRWFSRAGRAERLVVIPAVYTAVAIGGGEAHGEGAAK